MILVKRILILMLLMGLLTNPASTFATSGASQTTDNDVISNFTHFVLSYLYNGKYEPDGEKNKYKKENDKKEKKKRHHYDKPCSTPESDAIWKSYYQSKTLKDCYSKVGWGHNDDHGKDDGKHQYNSHNWEISKWWNWF